MPSIHATLQTTNVLAASLTMGAVSLNVRDIASMQSFYTGIIGLEVLKKEDQTLILGFNETPIVILHATPDLSPPSLDSAGLYHLAIVFSSRGDLARTVQRVLTDVPDLYTGSGDHLVSESFYLSDPEGNGVELYFDRDPSTWKWENGLVKMATLYIPEHDYVRQYSSVQEQGGRKIGHVHLKVGNIDEALQFYVETVGFTMTATMPSALFVSVGGYHHHLGMNTWESKGAGARAEALGLRNFELVLPIENDLAALRKRLEKAHILVITDSGDITFSDPWRNQLVVKVKS